MRKIKILIKSLLFILRGKVRTVEAAVFAPSKELEGKAILVTGGSSGYGLSIARQLARQGATVVITGRDKERLEAAVKEIGANNARALQWDIQESDAVEEKITEAESLAGLSLYGFVNNAGITRLKQHFTEKDWNDIMNTNTYSLDVVMAAEYEYLKKNGGGKIVNITSNACITSIFHPYYVSKTEAVKLTEAKAKDCLKDNIRINSVAPGVAITNINPALKTMIGNTGNVFFSGAKNRRYTLVEDVANIVVFMVKPQGDGLNGQNIIVDGGMSLA